MFVLVTANIYQRGPSKMRLLALIPLIAIQLSAFADPCVSPDGSFNSVTQLEASSSQITGALQSPGKIGSTTYSLESDPFECESNPNGNPGAGIKSSCLYLSWKDGSYSGKLFVRHVPSLKPNAETIVFINGGPGVGHQALFSESLLKLRERYNLVWYDQRGTASSYLSASDSLNTDVVGMKQYVSDLIAVKRVFSDKPAHLYGHSFGGLLAQTASKLYPDDVKSLVLMSPIYGVNGFADQMASGVSTMNPFDTQIAKLPQLTADEKSALSEKFKEYVHKNGSVKASLYDYPQFPGVDVYRETQETVPSGAIADSLIVAMGTYLGMSDFSKISMGIDRAFTDGKFLRGPIKVTRSNLVNGFTNHGMLCSLYPSFQEAKLNSQALSAFQDYCKTIMTKFEPDSGIAATLAQRLSKPVLVTTAKHDENRKDTILLRNDYPSANLVDLDHCDHVMLGGDSRCTPSSQIIEFFQNQNVGSKPQ
jgi:pimeloyl-ACP methyl ester carboxylesterase